MDTESREAYILTRPPIVDNEAARFVEENLKATNQNMSLVYSPPLDEFVSVEVGQSEQQVRYVTSTYKPQHVPRHTNS